MNNLGIDLGNVIVGKRQEGSKPFDVPPIDGAFEVISKLVKLFDDTYIVSRVNSEQRERALVWLETHDFYNKTGIIVTMFTFVLTGAIKLFLRVD